MAEGVLARAEGEAKAHGVEVVTDAREAVQPAVIIMTANLQSASETVDTLPVKCVIPKPFDIRELVAQVDVAVGRDRFGDEEVAGLVAAVVAVPGGVDPQRGGIGAEEDRPQGHDAHRTTVAGPPGGAYAPSARAITICWTSSVPSPMVRIFASR